MKFIILLHLFFCTFWQLSSAQELKSFQIAGQVLDEEKNPVQAASVELYNAKTQQIISTILTGSDGFFQEEFKFNRGVYYAIVSKDGFQNSTSQRITVRVPGEGYDLGIIVLKKIQSPGIALKGIVADAKTGQPISGAVLNFHSNVEIRDQQTTSDAQGNFLFQKITYISSFELLISADKFLSEKVHYDRFSRNDRIIDLGRILLQPIQDTVLSFQNATLTGQVLVNETQIPVPGATVHLYGTQVKEEIAETGVDGKFYFNNLPEGEYYISIRANDFNSENFKTYFITASSGNLDVGPLYLTPAKTKSNWLFWLAGGTIFLISLVFISKVFILNKGANRSLKLPVSQDGKEQIKIHPSDPSKDIQYEMMEESDGPDYYKAEKEDQADMSALLSENEEQWRFLQLKIKDDQGKENLRHLVPEKIYTLKVRIGHREKGFHQAHEPLDTDVVFNHTDASTVDIRIVFRTYNSLIKESIETISLPRAGNSTDAIFNFNSGNVQNFTGEIDAYFQNKLLQRISFSVPVNENEPEGNQETIQIKEIYNTRSDFSHLPNNRSQGASYTIREDEGNGTVVGAMVDEEYYHMYYSPGLEKLIEEIKLVLQRAIMDIEKYPEDLSDKNQAKLFTTLAIKGNTLFVHHLKKKSLHGPLQIVTNRPGFVPLDFAYEDAPPALEATMCTHAKEALKEGACRNCFDKTTTPASHVCPFGFWGLRQVIERSAVESRHEKASDYLIQAQPTGNRNALEVLNTTLYATSDRVDGAVPEISEKVAEAIKNNSTICMEAEDWEEWKKITQEKNPDSMILIVHVENHDMVNEDRMEIGNKKFLLQNYFDVSHIKPVPEKRSPFIIVVGCETSDLDEQGFDISSKLILEGAAIVLSNFTKISGRKAGPLVIRLVELLKENGSGDVLLGQILLKLRQQLVAEGIITGLSLVAYGDADWKIKS